MREKTVKTVEDAILEWYLDNKQALSVPEIRENCQLSETIIRKVLQYSCRIVPTTKDVKIMSKDCPGRVHQWRRVAAFHPTREWLVDIINSTRLELPHYIYDSTIRKGKR